MISDHLTDYEVLVGVGMKSGQTVYDPEDETGLLVYFDGGQPIYEWGITHI